MVKTREAQILYSINNWSETYENNRTRDLKKLLWIPIPAQLDGDGYTELVDRKNGAAIYGAWVACVIVAGRCDPRGTLVRDGGRAHDSTSLGRIIRMDKAIVQEMLDVAVSIGWLTTCEIPQEGAGFPQEAALQEGRKEGNGREGKEEQETVDRVAEVWGFYQTFGHQQAKLDDKRRKMILGSLKHYSVEELCKAIYGCHHNPHNLGHNERGTKYLNIEHCIGSSERIERNWQFENGTPIIKSQRETVNEFALKSAIDSLGDVDDAWSN